MAELSILIRFELAPWADGPYTSRRSWHPSYEGAVFGAANVSERWECGVGKRFPWWAAAPDVCSASGKETGLFREGEAESLEEAKGQADAALVEIERLIRQKTAAALVASWSEGAPEVVRGGEHGAG